MTQPTSTLERFWDSGQQHLAAGRYVAARSALESAEALAWRQQDAATLARLYLSLIESRRLMRHQAAAGHLLLADPHASKIHTPAFTQFLSAPAGTILLPFDDCRRVTEVEAAARRRGVPLEALVLLHYRGETRLISPVDLRFAAGLPVIFTANPNPLDPTAATAYANGNPAPFSIPLPPPALYDPAHAPTRALHTLATESLLIAWETLALRWQSRHPLPAAAPSPQSAWQELAWLRETLRIDPACEPAAMRLIALAESLERT